MRVSRNTRIQIRRAPSFAPSTYPYNSHLPQLQFYLPFVSRIKASFQADQSILRGLPHYFPLVTISCYVLFCGVMLLCRKLQFTARDNMRLTASLPNHDLRASLASALRQTGGQIMLASNTVRLYFETMGHEAESCTLGAPSVCLLPKISTRKRPIQVAITSSTALAVPETFATDNMLFEVGALTRHTSFVGSPSWYCTPP